jgi:hypothetical protein
MTLAVKKKRSVDWNARQMPFGERLHQAIEYLAFKSVNANALAACETIEKIVSEQKKFQFFRQFFPEEWKNSKASFFKRGYYHNYSERLNEFFQLVNEKMFPLFAGWDDPDMEFEHFYIFSLNIDLCCEDIEYENLRVSFVAGLLFLFRDEEIWDFFENNYQIKKEEFPEIDESPHENLWHLKESGKVEIYRNLFEIVDHSTGNVWLDTVNCRDYACFDWTEDTIIILTESYREATALLDQTAQVDASFAENPREVLLDLISLWNAGELPEKQ